jgi:hypothetical protein
MTVAVEAARKIRYVHMKGGPYSTLNSTSGNNERSTEPNIDISKYFVFVGA